MVIGVVVVMVMVIGMTVRMEMGIWGMIVYHNTGRYENESFTFRSQLATHAPSPQPTSPVSFTHTLTPTTLTPTTLTPTTLTLNAYPACAPIL